MTSICKWLGMGFIAALIVATPEGVSAGMATPDSIIVMPARKRVVQLAFEVARCKDVGLVTYNTGRGMDAPLIHVWNGQEWVQISLDDYVQGSFMSGEPKHVFLLGDAHTLPLRMMDEVAWYKNLERVTTLDITALVNTFGNSLKFSSRQWKWIAEKNGLSIKDQNTERRRYGRWGAPGKEVELKPTKVDSIEMPPSAIIADPIAEPKHDIAKPKTEKPVTDAVKIEEPKTEPVKTEAAKVEPIKTETVKVEPVKAETAKVEPVKTVPIKTETPKVESKIELKPVPPPVPPVVEKPVPAQAVAPVQVPPEIPPNK